MRMNNRKLCQSNMNVGFVMKEVLRSAERDDCIVLFTIEYGIRSRYLAKASMFFNPELF